MQTGQYPLIAVVVWQGCQLAYGQAQNQPASYVGSEICQACHEVVFNAFLKTPHAVVETDKQGRWAGKACEACHGPGSKHAESTALQDIRNPVKVTAAAADKVCLNCHLNQSTHAGRLRTSHVRNLVACTECHKIHHTGESSLVARRIVAINEQCTGCHQNVWAEFQRPYHHRLPENAMSCVDCHNPHGTLLRVMTQAFAANEPGCLNCHGDKRGPFTFEHPPMRFEGCPACHQMHGSQNPRMLTRQEVFFVCLECHANVPGTPNPGRVLGVVPPAFHDLRSPRYQNCTVCHQKIHGSYVDRNLLQ